MKFEAQSNKAETATAFKHIENEVKKVYDSAVKLGEQVVNGAKDDLDAASELLEQIRQKTKQD